jgi:biopolymer transport protein ExbD
MAGIDSGSAHGARRELNRDLLLVPFIDFLLCLVAFLLVTAVWSQHARLKADAKVPGVPTGIALPPALELHVAAREHEFLLTWRQGETVLESIQVPKTATEAADGSLSYTELARVALAQWQARGSHRAPSDGAQDRVVVHTPNSLEFRALTAMLDALHAPQRAFHDGRTSKQIPSFAVALATD